MKETKIKGININLPERSNWCCYLFGTENSGGFVYHPYKDNVPNAFARWMMKICFGCTWVKEQND